MVLFILLDATVTFESSAKNVYSDLFNDDRRSLMYKRKIIDPWAPILIFNMGLIIFQSRDYINLVLKQIMGA
jgi:hypothetical protein